jgi:hypothetical protein
MGVPSAPCKLKVIEIFSIVDVVGINTVSINVLLFEMSFAGPSQFLLLESC